MVGNIGCSGLDPKMMWLFANAMSKTVLARYACIAKFNNVNLTMTLTFKVVMQECQSHHDLDI